MSKLEIKEPYRTVFVRNLVRKIYSDFSDPNIRAEFEQWYREKNGKDYVWKRASIVGNDEN